MGIDRRASGAKGFETVRTYAVADSATWAHPDPPATAFVKDVESLALWTLY